MEPRIKEQWYVKCDDMVNFALEVSTDIVLFIFLGGSNFFQIFVVHKLIVNQTFIEEFTNNG